MSLPDHAFRKSGAQNKTSILFFRKFTALERVRWHEAYDSAIGSKMDEEDAFLAALSAVDYLVFLAEAAHVGYTPTGSKSDRNDLYRSNSAGFVATDQEGSILGELFRFRSDSAAYLPHNQPDCMSVSITDMWSSHTSHRLDPKYFLFKLEEQAVTPEGWVRKPIGKVMRRRDERVQPEQEPEATAVVLTIRQTGEVKDRAAGKGHAPPEWRGMYFEDMPTKWYGTRAGDVVFSSIDLWKGCIAVVPESFDGALVSKEFPVYEILDDRLHPQFLSTLLRSRYYQRAFRAITTGHSNRRRTQTEDFEELEICYPADPDVQNELVADIVSARQGLRDSAEDLHQSMLAFSDLIDQRGAEEYEVDDERDRND